MEIFFCLICTVLAIAAFGFIVSEIEDETVRMTCFPPIYWRIYCTTGYAIIIY